MGKLVHKHLSTSMSATGQSVINHDIYQTHRSNLAEPLSIWSSFKVARLFVLGVNVGLSLPLVECFNFPCKSDGIHEWLK